MQPVNMALPGTLTPQQQQAVNALQNAQQVMNNFPYWSRGRFNVALASGGGSSPSVYTMAPQEIVLFGYGKGFDMGQAGRPGVLATLADTNIQSPGETIGGQYFFIQDIGIQLNSNSEPEFAKAAQPEISVRISLDGGMNTFNAGTLTQMPGGGGLTGIGMSAIDAQPIPGGRPLTGAMANGWPVNKNKATYPSGLIWKPKGQPDSNMQIILRVERAVTITTQLGNEAGATGIRGYTNPDPTALFIDVTCTIDGSVQQKRGSNA